MKRKSKICLISGGHLSSNPRLLKEAGALHRQGYSVRAMTAQTVGMVAKFDGQIMGRCAWHTDPVEVFAWGMWRRFRVRQKRQMALKRILDGDLSLMAFADWISPWSDEHLRKIESLKPDFIIAHTLPSLVTAVRAHERWKIPFGFDLEDYHPQERPGGLRDPFNQASFFLLKECLPKAAYVTSASPFFNDELKKDFGYSNTALVLNCFSLKHHCFKPLSSSGIPSFFWFSQILGLDRGLQEVFEACVGLKGQFFLHLHGHVMPAVRKELWCLADRYGIRSRIKLSDWCLPEQLMEEASTHHVGLAVERQDPLNRDMCITNKIMTYPLVGLAVVASATTGQSWVMKEAPEMGRHYIPGDIQALREILQNWLDHRNLLEQARHSAHETARQKFCWEKQEVIFLNTVEKHL